MSMSGKRSLAALVGIGAAPLVLSASLAHAEIAFEDKTEEAGILGKGTTFGASWGDFNGDGRPDVWVSNHNATPALYLNRGDGTFVDVVDSVWSADAAADTHGAAWGDFDNDGDQDLVEVVDVVVAENMCFGCAPNHFYVNANGELREAAREHGLHYPATQARTPLWLDADVDGKLDLLVTGREADSSQYAVFFEQGDDGFEAGGEWSGLAVEGTDSLSLNANVAFAQLTDFEGDGRLELVVFGRDTRIFSMGRVPFRDVTRRYGLPGQSGVSDLAVADFDGDLKPDIFLLHGLLPYTLSQMAMIAETELFGTLAGHDPGVASGLAQGIRFRASGNVRFALDPEWFSVRNMAIGESGLMPVSRTFELSPGDPAVAGLAPPDGAGAGTLRIGYDPATRYWSLQNAAPFALVDFRITADGAIGDFEYLNWDGFSESGGQGLFIQRDRSFSVRDSLPRDKQNISCHSVVAADFDNDMDIDLYLVCAGPATNLPNRLYENDGSGAFTLVASAGGAEGSSVGRGDVAVAADYDLDGYLDLFVTNGFDPTSPLVAEGPHELFRNRGGSNHWLEIDLEGTLSNRDGIGAVVTVEANGVRQVRIRDGGMHLHAQNHMRLHFGLGGNRAADAVTVRWPSGLEQRLEGVVADQVLEIVESNDVR